jgi:mannitol-1-phosphate 5-dehydrogenase
MREAKKKIIIFGAGKIGRSFIGQIFNRSGYEVVFVNISARLIDLINEKKQYRVVIKSNKGDEIIPITHVRGIHLDDTETLVEELTDVPLMALSVGQQGLPAALPLIAMSLLKRQQKYDHWPLDIIIAENMRNADQFIAGELAKLLPTGFPLNELVGLVESSIGKMVPMMSGKDLEEDLLQVFAEPYNSLIVAKDGFKNRVPDVDFLAPKENIKAWVDRKLFIHNLGHATAAYLGFQKNPKWVYLYEALADREIFLATRETMLQSAEILMALYPGEFTRSDLIYHIDDLLERFQNKALGDTIFRVGCDLYRKLGPEDRLAGPVHVALKHGKPYDRIIEAIKAAMNFKAMDINGAYFHLDEEFFEEVNIGIEYVLNTICMINMENRN